MNAYPNNPDPSVVLAISMAALSVWFTLASLDGSTAAGLASTPATMARYCWSQSAVPANLEVCEEDRADIDFASEARLQVATRSGPN